MDERDQLADELAHQFEANRAHLRAVAYRMLGSASEADDALQEAWLRFSRAGTDGVDNLGGWLTTIVSRVCLNMLRARRTRREEVLDEHPSEPVPGRHDGIDPEQEALLADAVGPALLVVLETLAPAERLAFVLHDMFAVPFDEIAPIVGRSPAAARQLASRARRRVRGEVPVPEADLTRQRQVVDAFLAASRNGDFEGLLAVLDPDVVFRADDAAVRVGGVAELRGAAAVARGAGNFAARYARWIQPALVDGELAVVLAPYGRLTRVMRLAVSDGRITAMDVVGDPHHLRRLDITILDT